MLKLLEKKLKRQRKKKQIPDTINETNQKQRLDANLTDHLLYIIRVT